MTAISTNIFACCLPLIRSSNCCGDDWKASKVCERCHEWKTEWMESSMFRQGEELMNILSGYKQDTFFLFWNSTTTSCVQRCYIVAVVGVPCSSTSFTTSAISKSLVSGSSQEATVTKSIAPPKMPTGSFGCTRVSKGKSCIQSFRSSSQSITGCYGNIPKSNIA